MLILLQSQIREVKGERERVKGERAGGRERQFEIERNKREGEQERDGGKKKEGERGGRRER